MVTYRIIIKIDEYAIRLNFPSARGIFGKIDRFLFRYIYGNEKRKWYKNFIPCFMPFPVLRKQLVVDGKPIYLGGGTNTFGESISVKPTIVTSETLRHCREAYAKGYHKIRNFTYNGFGGELLSGYTNYTTAQVELTNDPGIWKCICSDGKVRLIPGWAIEGVQIHHKPQDTDKQYILFGTPSVG